MSLFSAVAAAPADPILGLTEQFNADTDTRKVNLGVGVYLGDDEYGHPRFNTTRSEPGEALYQLKYRADWNQVQPLAAQLREEPRQLGGMAMT